MLGWWEEGLGGDLGEGERAAELGGQAFGWIVHVGPQKAEQMETRELQRLVGGGELRA